MIQKTSFSPSRALTLAALGIALNVALGTFAKLLHIPLLFLDTLGTIFVAALLGPFYGALTGGLTNVVTGIVTSPTEIPFALVNIVVGVIVGTIARKYGFSMKTALLTGLLLAVIAPLIGTPIAVWLFGGLTGGTADLLVGWLRATGSKLFAAAFISRIAENLVDKVACCALVSYLLHRLGRNRSEFLAKR